MGSRVTWLEMGYTYSENGSMLLAPFLTRPHPTLMWVHAWVVSHSISLYIQGWFSRTAVFHNAFPFWTIDFVQNMEWKWKCVYPWIWGGKPELRGSHIGILCRCYCARFALNYSCQTWWMHQTHQFQIRKGWNFLLGFPDFILCQFCGIWAEHRTFLPLWYDVLTWQPSYWPTCRSFLCVTQMITTLGQLENEKHGQTAELYWNEMVPAERNLATWWQDCIIGDKAVTRWLLKTTCFNLSPVSKYHFTSHFFSSKSMKFDTEVEHDLLNSFPVGAEVIVWCRSL